MRYLDNLGAPECIFYRAILLVPSRIYFCKAGIPWIHFSGGRLARFLCNFSCSIIFIVGRAGLLLWSLRFRKSSFLVRESERKLPATLINACAVHHSYVSGLSIMFSCSISLLQHLSSRVCSLLISCLTRHGVGSSQLPPGFCLRTSYKKKKDAPLPSTSPPGTQIMAT